VSTRTSGAQKTRQAADIGSQRPLPAACVFFAVVFRRRRAGERS
jgi:hypothetical protein